MMNEKEFNTKYHAMAPVLRTDLAALLESVRAGERENAARICDAVVSLATYRGQRVQGIAKKEQFAIAKYAKGLADDIRSGERAAPVDGVADEAKTDEREQMICRVRELEGGLYRAVKIIGKLYGTFGNDETDPKGIDWHRITKQHNRLLDMSLGTTPWPVNGQTDAGNKANQQGFYGYENDTPDPAAAVTADEGESGDGARCPDCGEFTRQFMDGAGVWRFDWHREGKSTCCGSYCPHPVPDPFWNAEAVKAFNASTAPPVANEWRTDQDFPLNQPVEVCEYDNGITWTQIFDGARWKYVGKGYPAPIPKKWRYIVEPSASDTVADDLTDNDKESYETRWFKACARHLQAVCDLAVAKAERDHLAATCADYKRTVTGLRRDLRFAQEQYGTSAVKWDYMRADLDGSVSQLNEFGEVGWELCGRYEMLRPGHGCFVCGLFKRRVSTSPEGE